MHQEDTGRPSTPGDTPTYGVKENTADIRELELPPNGNSNGRDGIGGGGYIHCLTPEKSITVHHDQNDHGYLSGGGVPP